MKPHPRIRTTIRYGGAALTVLLVVVWLGSVWWYARFTTRTGHMVSIASGRAVFYANLRSYSIFDEVGWAAGANWFRCQWGADWTFDNHAVTIIIPFWIPVATLFLTGGLAWRLDAITRRTHSYLCPTCYYDRTGLPAKTNCPECGQPPP